MFAFAARPAYDDGTLHDWAWYLLNNNGLTPRTMGKDHVAGVPAVVGEATQPSELGTMVVRFAFFEDGGRLVNITFSAPELLADAVREAWFALLPSFALETEKGSRFTDGTVMPATEARKVDPDIAAYEADRAAEEAAAAKPDPTFADFAFGDTAETLDQENRVNANLRDKGISSADRYHQMAARGCHSPGRCSSDHPGASR